jgi:hypothetical protein
VFGSRYGLISCVQPVWTFSLYYIGIDPFFVEVTIQLQLVCTKYWCAELRLLVEERQGPQIRKVGLTGLLTSCVGTAFYVTSLNDRQEGWKDGEEDLNSYWMTLRKRDDI